MSAEVDSAFRWSRERFDHAVEAGVFDGDRVELLDGQIAQMPPQSREHDTATRWLRDHLVRGTDPRVWLVGEQAPVALSDWSEPKPDGWLARLDHVAERAHPGTAAMHRSPDGDAYRYVSTAVRGVGIKVSTTDLIVDVDELLGP